MTQPLHDPGHNGTGPMPWVSQAWPLIASALLLAAAWGRFGAELSDTRSAILDLRTEIHNNQTRNDQVIGTIQADIKTLIGRGRRQP